MRDEQPVLRAVAPPTSVYRPRPGEARQAAHLESLEQRIAHWQRYYERGPGFRRAVAEAWTIVVRRHFARQAFLEAAQWVGWPIRRLVWALDRVGLEFPPHLRAWRDRHRDRYAAERHRRKP